MEDEKKICFKADEPKPVDEKRWAWIWDESEADKKEVFFVCVCLFGSKRLPV